MGSGVKVAALGLGIPAGLYVGMVSYRVAEAGLEEKRASDRVTEELATASNLEQGIIRDTKSAEGLKMNLKATRQAMEQMDKQLSSLETQISELQSRRTKSLQSAAQAQQSLVDAQRRLQEAASLRSRHLENADAARAALESAAGRISEARALFNPMNHPVVKAYFDRA